MAVEFEVGGHRYAYGKMDAMTQFHVICKFGPAMKRAAESGGTTILETFGALSDQDREFIVSRCLAVVKRQSGDRWADVWERSAGRLMFEDINALSIMDISSKVMEESFRDFFPEAPSDLTEEDQE
jgi:hypothetical protein